ncbi:MAG: DUF2799 domain-containing protein, partial [Bacteriovoracaceae bacterium]|nr:DUF2799 domain-containing protein [Bacteriovoracaceae bacterium]
MKRDLFIFFGVLVFILLLTSILNSCSSISKEDCQRKNWYEIGKKFGSRLSDFKESYNSVVEACAEYKVKPNIQDMLVGYEDALKKACSFDLAKNDVMSEKSRNIRCLPYKNYMKGYDEGLALFCTYENGMDHGQKGRSYTTICPENMLRNYLRGHSAGKIIFEQRKYHEQILAKHTLIHEKQAANLKKIKC